MEELLLWIEDRYTFGIIDRDLKRPWGGFLVVDESLKDKFIRIFFPDYKISDAHLPITPKFLLISPLKRLSLQKHERRSEAWKIIYGSVKAIINDHEIMLYTNDTVHIRKNTSHRLIGLDDWAIVAEIWIHDDPENPSDENDIIRIQDDFGR